MPATTIRTSPIPSLFFALALAVPLSAQSVLVHTAMDTGDLNKYSGYGSLMVTAVGDAGWMAMTPAQFAAYDMIWLGGNCCSASLYNVIYSTRMSWQPAITGRVVVTSLDPAKHGQAGATTFSDAVATWLLAGGGTALYVSPDWGYRSFDFMSPGLGSWSNTQHHTNLVDVTMPAHPTMLGSTGASLSGWGNSSHVDILTYPATGWTVVATLTGTTFPAVIVRDGPSCAITAPVAMSTAGAVVNVNFDGDQPGGLPLDLDFEWSDDGGMTWVPATAAPGSPTSNPMLGVPTPISGAAFDWDSLGDGVGIASVATVDFRINVDDGSTTSSCTVTFDVDNVPPPATCMLTVAPGPLMGEIDLDVDAASLSSPTVTVTLDFSTDAGATFQPMTMAASSPGANPAVGIPTGPASYRWDSRTDGVGIAALEPGVILRASIEDGVSPVPGDCSETRDIDNTMICGQGCGNCNLDASGPDVIDALTAAQVSAGLFAPTVEQAACCDVNTSGAVDVIDALFIAQSAVGLPVVLVCV